MAVGDRHGTCGAVKRMPTVTTARESRAPCTIPQMGPGRGLAQDAAEARARDALLKDLEDLTLGRYTFASSCARTG